MDVDLALDGVDVGDGGEVEVLAPDKGLQLVQEGPGARQVAGAGPSLDERRPFPVLANALVVVEGRRRGDGGWRGPRVRAQPQVDPEDVAVGRALLHQLGQPVRQADGEGLGLDPIGQGHELRLKEDRDVDVAGIVELEGAVLAHGDAEESRRGTVGGVRGGPEPARRHLCAGGGGEGGGQGRIGEARQGARDPVKVPGPAKVGQGGEQVDLRLEPPQARASGLGGSGGEGAGLREEELQMGVRIRVQQADEAGRVAANESCEGGRGAEDRRKRGAFRRREGTERVHRLEKSLGGPGVDDRTAGLDAGGEGRHATAGRMSAARSPGPDPS